MCEYNDYEHNYDKILTIRKPHECASCLKPFPAKTKMELRVGTYEGEPWTGHVCLTCVWLEKARKHEGIEEPLHMCYGWAWGDDNYPDGEETYQYVKKCLENNQEPTEAGLKSHLEQQRALEEA